MFSCTSPSRRESAESSRLSKSAGALPDHIRITAEAIVGRSDKACAAWSAIDTLAPGFRFSSAFPLAGRSLASVDLRELPPEGSLITVVASALEWQTIPERSAPPEQAAVTPFCRLCPA